MQVIFMSTEDFFKKLQRKSGGYRKIVKRISQTDLLFKRFHIMPTDRDLFSVFHLQEQLSFKSSVNGVL